MKQFLGFDLKVEFIDKDKPIVYNDVNFKNHDGNFIISAEELTDWFNEASCYILIGDDMINTATITRVKIKELTK